MAAPPNPPARRPGKGPTEMDMLSQFFGMGGYAGFIWPAYGIVAVVLIGLFVAGKRFQRAADEELASLNPRARRASETTPETAPGTAHET